MTIWGYQCTTCGYSNSWLEYEQNVKFSKPLAFTPWLCYNITKGTPALDTSFQRAMLKSWPDYGGTVRTVYR